MRHYNLSVNYKPGVSNVPADALSRIHENNNQLDDASCYHKWCEDVSVPVSCIQHTDVNALLMRYSTDDQPYMDAVMAADLNRESTVVVVVVVCHDQVRRQVSQDFRCRGS